MAEGIAVLDLGKTNLKLVVVDPEGRTVDSRMAPNRPLPGPPYPHVDVDHVWRWLLDALASAVRRHLIRAIVPCAYGSTAALVGADGLAVPVMDSVADPPD